MRKIKIYAVMLLATALYGGLIFWSSRATGKDGSPSNSQPVAVSDWSLKTISDKTIQSTDLKGKVVILDFWATWCGPCREEIPNFMALQKQYADQGLVIVGASVDDGGAGIVKKFAGDLHINYPVGLADDKFQSNFGGIEVLPTTFIIDRQGRVVKKYIGLTEKSDFETEIKSLLQAKN